MSQLRFEYMNHMGNDDSVVNAARVSFDKDASTFSDADNARLIKYLATGMSSKEYTQLLQDLIEVSDLDTALSILDKLDADTHWTPFAHTALTLRCAAPVPIRTQC